MVRRHGVGGEDGLGAREREVAAAAAYRLGFGKGLSVGQGEPYASTGVRRSIYMWLDNTVVSLACDQIVLSCLGSSLLRFLQRVNAPLNEPESRVRGQ